MIIIIAGVDAVTITIKVIIIDSILLFFSKKFVTDVIYSIVKIT